MPTKINSYILSDRLIQKMKDMTNESDELGKILGFLLLKTKKGEIIERKMARGIPEIQNIIGVFHTQTNEKEPTPDLHESYRICRDSHLIHCIGADSKISCYKRKSDTMIDCEKLRIMSLERWVNVTNVEEAKKLIEEDKKISKDIIKEHFNKIDVA